MAKYRKRGTVVTDIYQREPEPDYGWVWGLIVIIIIICVAAN